MHLLFNFVSRLFIPRIMEWSIRENNISFFQFSILSISSCSIICVLVHCVYIIMHITLLKDIKILMSLVFDKFLPCHSETIFMHA